jgi:hypothetical protein
MTLRWPLGGLNRTRAFREQPPFSTPDCLNVRPDGTIKERQRGGSRPGLGKAYYEDLGTEIRMMAELTHVEDGGYHYLIDGFDGTALNTRWTQASWLTNAPAILSDLATASSGDEETGVVLTNQSQDLTQDYQIDLFIVPRSGTHNGEYRIYARMDDTTPDASADGIECNLILSGATGAYSGTLKSYVSGTPTTTNFSTGNNTSAQSGIFRVHISGTTVTCSWLGTQVASATVAAHSGNHRVGFGMKSTVAGELAVVDYFQLQYKKASDTRKARRKMLMASSGGTLYKETFYGTLAAVSSSLTLVSDRKVRAVDRGQNLYIADHGDPRAVGTSGAIAGAGNDELDDAGVSDWTALGIDTDDDVAVLSGFSAGTAGTYKISSLATTEVTLTTSPGAGTGGTYSIERGPKIYNPATDAITLWTATTGQVPSGCKLIARYRDRLVLAGDQATPHAWYMSRQGDPLDWNYSQDFDDAQRAVAGSTSEAGLVGEPVNALVTHNDDYLLFGCDSSLWVLRGDPAFNGQIDNLSHSVGIIDGDAYCHGPNGEVVFLSRDGIYALASVTSPPVSLSRESLPAEMIDIDTETYEVGLVYDIRDRGVHVYITPKDVGGTGLHFWFDWELKSWWPYSFATGVEPTAVLRYNSDVAQYSNVLLGCRDGYVRRFFDANERDEATVFSSYIQYGPFALSPNDYNEGLANEITGRLAKGSGSVTWALQVGDDQEAAQGAGAFETATWTAGTNYVERPRARGMAAVLKLTGGGQRWAVEGCTLLVQQLGRQRVL